MSIDTMFSLYPSEWYPALYLGIGQFEGLSNLDVLWNQDFTYFRVIEA